MDQKYISFTLSFPKILQLKKIFLLLPVFILCLNGFAQQEGLYDAVFEYAAREYTLSKDGSSELKVIKKVRLLTHMSFHRMYGETFIVYNPQYQQLKINEAYTIMADGKKIKTPANAFNEVLPRFASAAPQFNHLKEMVVTHTGTERGAVIYLDYTIRTNKDYSPFFMAYDLLAENSPVQEMDLAVRVPLNTPLKYNLFNIRTVAQTKIENGMQVYRWNIKSIPAYFPEPLQQKETRYLPVLFFSTAKDLEHACSWYLNQKAFQFNVSDRMQKAVDLLKQGKDEEIKAALAIQASVVNDLQLVPVPQASIAFRVRTPDEIWQSNYATESEKAILLASLFRAAGFKAEPVAVAGANFNRDFGNLMNWDQFMVRLRLKGEDPVFMSVASTDDQSQWYRMDGKYFIILDPAAGLTASTGKIPASGLSCSFKLRLDTALKLDGTMNLEMEGACNPYFELCKGVKKINAYIRGGMASSELKDEKSISYELLKAEVTSGIFKKSAMRKEGDYVFFEIPWSDRGVYSWKAGELPVTRSNFTEIPFRLSEAYDISITLPEGWSAVVPEKLTCSNEAGDFKFRVSVSGNELHIQKSIRFTTVSGPPGLYNGVRELLNNWNAKIYREIVLKIK